MTKETVQSILRRIHFLDWEFRVGVYAESGPIWIQVVFDAEVEGSDDLKVEQHGRKWVISEHAVASEVVKTAWLAVCTAVEHEAREAFLLDGKAVFGPHIDVSALHGVADIHERRNPPKDAIPPPPSNAYDHVARPLPLDGAKVNLSTIEPGLEHAKVSVEIDRLSRAQDHMISVGWTLSGPTYPDPRDDTRAIFEAYRRQTLHAS